MNIKVGLMGLLPEGKLSKDLFDDRLSILGTAVEGPESIDPIWSNPHKANECR